MYVWLRSVGVLYDQILLGFTHLAVSATMTLPLRLAGQSLMLLLNNISPLLLMGGDVTKVGH